MIERDISKTQLRGGDIMEKVINELRVIETDDGFRVEIKGDKEKIKAFMSDIGSHKRRHGRGGRSWGPVPFGPWMWMKAAACHGPWDFEVEEEQPEKPTKA
jgi:hypothetical protein